MLATAVIKVTPGMETGRLVLEISVAADIDERLFAALLEGRQFQVGDVFSCMNTQVRFVAPLRLVTPSLASDTIQASNPALSGLGLPQMDEDEVVPRWEEAG